MQLLKVTGYEGVFIFCVALQGLALLYGIFWIQNDGPPRLSLAMFTEMFNLKALLETVHVCTRKRPKWRRL